MVTNYYTNEERLSIANEIWRQLGSQRFSLMTGCNPLAYGEQDGKVFLMMTVGKNSHSINRFEVAYNEGQDLYEIRFICKRGTQAHVVAQHKEVYCDMLHTIFEQETGLNTKIFYDRLYRDRYHA